jgi:2-aminoadipate transaminase
MVMPLPTKEREARIQSGVHYCEMLPLEYVPSQAYLDMFDRALKLYAGMTAAAVASAARQIVASRGEDVALVSLARERDFLIVEDSPYRELRYSGEPVPTIYSLAPERTLHLGSFSKIFAPGFRLGWILGPTELLDQIYVCKQSLDLCPPIFDQYIAAEFMGSGALDANLQKSIALYRAKRDKMLSLLEKYMPEGVSWTHPEGGLFLFLTLPEGFDTVALYDRALSAGVAYVAGSFFYPDGSHRNTMRMNFSFLDASRMEAGVQLLAEVIKNH